MLSPPPSVPGARRPDDAARGVRRRRGPPLAYVGDGNNVARSLAILGALAGRRGGVAAPDGYQLEEPHGARLVADPARRSPARTPSTPTSGCRCATTGDGSRAPRGARALPARRRAARPRRGRRVRAALPARAPGRGDHRRGPLRRSRSASGTRPRTAATLRRRCWSCSLGRLADHATSTPCGPQEGRQSAPSGGGGTGPGPQQLARYSTRARSWCSPATGCRRSSTTRSTAGA